MYRVHPPKNPIHPIYRRWRSEGDKKRRRTAFAGGDDLLGRALTHHVDDVERAIDLVGQNDRPVRRLALNLPRPQGRNRPANKMGRRGV